MDIVTHGLASLAVVRGVFPRADRHVTVFAILAGTIADIDRLSSFEGPASFLAWHGTYLHSILAALVIFAAIPAGPVARMVLHRQRSSVPHQPDVPNVQGEAISSSQPIRRGVFAAAFAAPACAALLHIAMDACQSDGVMLLWPFSTKRFAADWLPAIDPWILTILIGAIALPELFHLVNAEIGSRSKKPHGRTGAVLGLALVFAYIGARGMFHTNAVALMESRTFHGEAARRASAYPESLSLITWHGIAETESALNEIDVNAFAAATFDADTSVRVYKPQPSPALEAARNTRAAQQFLAIAQVPKATVEKTDVGSVVILRDMRYAAAGETQREIAALIELDPDNKVTSQELVWARDLRN